jgi:hypothetical protein
MFAMARHLLFRNLLTGVAILVLAAPSAAQRLAPIDLDAALPAAEVERVLVARAPGTPFHLRGLRDTAGAPISLELRRLEVLTPEFQLLVDGQRADFDRESIVFLAGRVEEWQDSTAVLSLRRERGVYEGVIRHGERAYRLTGDGLGKRSLGEQLLLTELPPESLDEFQRKTDVAGEVPRPPARPGAAFTKASAARTAVFAVDGDYEFFTIVGSEEGAVAYAGTMLAAISEVYESQVGLAIKLGTVSVWTTPDDPYTSSDNPFCEVGNFWAANRPRQQFPRAATLMFTGKATLFAGASALNGLCSYDHDSPLGGCVQGSYAVVNVQNNLPGARVDTTAHEIGHMVGSVHTHCYSPPIDHCQSGETGCYVGPKSTPEDGGSIMSYCFGSVVMSLGEPGKYGVNSERVPAVISEFLAALDTVPVGDPDHIAACLTGYELRATTQGTTVALHWTDNQTGEKKWWVEYRQGTTGGWKKLARPANATAANVTKLVRSKTYQFRVRAQLKKGFSPYSELVEVTIP